MTEEKFTKLTDEDLELVAGGAEFLHATITPSDKPGKYDIETVYFEGDAQSYADYRAGKPVDRLKCYISIGHSSGVPAEKLNARINTLKERGYKIIRK